jgi:hypothetical protein
MRLILADHLSTDRLTEHLQQRHVQVADHRAALERMNGDLEGEIDTGQRLTLNYGLAIANAELLWLENVLQQLSLGKPYWKGETACST